MSTDGGGVNIWLLTPPPPPGLNIEKENHAHKQPELSDNLRAHPITSMLRPGGGGGNIHIGFPSEVVQTFFLQQSCWDSCLLPFFPPLIVRNDPPERRRAPHEGMPPQA